MGSLDRGDVIKKGAPLSINEIIGKVRAVTNSR
jgi:hypothetical protein